MPAYGDNYFCGDLGDARRTADYICTQKGYAAGAVSFTVAAKPPGSYCAYKIPSDTPSWGLLRNMGSGTQVLSQISCGTCGAAVLPTTVVGTLGIGSYGDNYFCGDLGETTRTADFICTWREFLGALTYSATAKPAGSFCACRPRRTRLTRVCWANMGLVRLYLSMQRAKQGERPAPHSRRARRALARRVGQAWSDPHA